MSSQSGTAGVNDPSKCRGYLTGTASATLEVWHVAFRGRPRAGTGGCLAVPANRMKGGREHRVPLSSRCVQILERAKALSNGKECIFPGRVAGKPLSNMAFLMTLRRYHPTSFDAETVR